MSKLTFEELKTHLWHAADILDEKGGIAGTGTIDVYYNLPIDDNNISVGFRYQKFVDVLTEDPYLDFGFLDTYSLNFNYSKVFSF